MKASIREFGNKDIAHVIKLGKETFEVPDPKALIDRFITRIEKWTRLLAGVDRKDEAALVELIKSEVYDRIDVNAYGVN